ncbi:MAG: N-acetylmannosamine-6-phosphate 2-epimerase [Bacteroidetes bacterium]|nr:N-acetylmannosamine-6-phosphate 2-epimerase [Bacteroidota bacterium]
MHELLTGLRHGLIVTCQPDGEPPFNTTASVIAFAQSALAGGAAAIRTEGAQNVSAIRPLTDLPVIGFADGQFTNGWPCLTPDFKAIDALLAAGADMISLDVTPRRRPNGMDGIEFFDEVRDRYDVPLIADIATFEEGIRAAEMGADAVATTLAGFTEYSQATDKNAPDLTLIEELARALSVPVIAQGRIWTPAQAAEAIRLGAYSVVVGSAVTRPAVITRRFIDAVAPAAH